MQGMWHRAWPPKLQSSRQEVTAWEKLSRLIRNCGASPNRCSLYFRPLSSVHCRLCRQFSRIRFKLRRRQYGVDSNLGRYQGPRPESSIRHANFGQRECALHPRIRCSSSPAAKRATRGSVRWQTEPRARLLSISTCLPAGCKALHSSFRVPIAIPLWPRTYGEL